MADGSVTSSMTKSATTLFAKLKENLPQSPMMWIVALTCVVLLITLSRMLALQRSIQDLQEKPSVDESVVRQLVRQQLEETVKSIEQQNKAHMQMHAMRAQQDAARQQAAVLVPVASSVEAVPPKAVLPAVVVPVASSVEPVEAVPPKAPAVIDGLDEKLDDEPVPVEKVRRKKA